MDISTCIMELTSEGEFAFMYICTLSLKKKENTNLHKYAVSGILLLYSLIAPSDKEQGDKSVLSERKHSEKLERSP